MKSISWKYLWAIIPVFFLVLFSYGLLIKENDYKNIPIYTVIASIGLYLLLSKKDLFISLCIFFVPISVSVTDIGGATVVAPSELMTVLLAGVAVVMGIVKPFFTKKILFHPITLILLLDVAWMVITSLFSDMHLYSFKRVIARSCFLLVFYLLIAEWMMKKENMLKFFLLYTLGLIIPIFLTEYKHGGYGFNPKTVYELCMPYFNDHTIYGAALAYVLPFILILAVNGKVFNLNRSFRIFNWVLFFVFLAAEILSFSRAAWLSLGMALLMFVFLKLRLRFWHFMVVLITTIILFISYLDPLYQMARENDNLSNKGEIGEHLMSVGNLNSDASNLERINRWMCAYKMFEDRPITGFGPGTYQFTYGPYQSVYEMTYISTTAGDKGNAHSEPLTYLAETGLPGFIIYIGWMLASIGFGITAYHRAKDNLVKNMILAALLGFCTFFFHGLVNSFIDQIKLASLVFGSMAMIVVADVAFKNKEVQHEVEKKDL